jgi:hypothetical protein
MNYEPTSVVNSVAQVEGTAYFLAVAIKTDERTEAFNRAGISEPFMAFDTEPSDDALRWSLE